ncbi:hypothetical protein VitviT2T_025382 [Vitis vinifera]|uniref:Reverse transcriptase/retrotransposon-derived protein RNase H-like domain-containing protein n=1 Tax=Vitis vinifera TaxID=29760 RepID=A0ABY9DMF0_VITVI|nr:hypothetical protein VitviT2T_025382 [Vitis vinifera]
MDECRLKFEVVKRYLTKSPILSNPKSDEQLYMYLTVFNCAISVILFRHIQDKEQMPIYYVSKAMVDTKTRHSRIKKTTLALKSTAQNLRSYFQAHQVTILTNQPLYSTLHKLDLSRRMLKQFIKLSEYEIKHHPRLALKGQVMVDFIAKLPKKPAHAVEFLGEQWWTLYVDRASRVSGFGVGLILQSPIEELLEKAICLNFSISNNEAKYEVILAGLNLAITLSTTKLEIKSNS